MTPHQENRLRLLTERGTVAFTREENLRKLAVECLELALVIEHHLEGKRGLEDIAYEGADAQILLVRAKSLVGQLPPDGSFRDRGEKWNLCVVAYRATLTNVCIFQLAYAQCERDLVGSLSRLESALSWLRTHVGEQDWSSALDIKLSKAERYITDRELGRQPMSLLARPAGGLE